MTMLAEVLDAVVGVDTHRDTHTLELAAPSGAPIATLTVRNDTAGFAAAIAWAASRTPGSRVVFGLEGSRSYGVGLARALAAVGLAVLEVERPRRADRRRGKSDAIDAHAAVLAVLRCDAARIPTPRADGDREALRILLGAREDLTGAKTAQANRLRALLLTGRTDGERELARRPLTEPTLSAIVRRRGGPDADTEDAVRRAECRRLALAIRAADRALASNRAQLRALVAAVAPGLLGRRGCGPVSAAQVLVSYSHPGRCRNDAAFAALAGTAPLPASSGRTVRHRLNRGGDRALNRAIHTIALTRLRSCPRTKAYAARRQAEGKTDREIRRCLKRYITRELFRSLQAAGA